MLNFAVGSVPATAEIRALGAQNVPCFRTPEFSEIKLELHQIPHTAIELTYGTPLTEADLSPFDGQDYTAFLVNLGETSQDILYDADLISRFCKKNNLFLIVDGISSFLANPFDMEAHLTIECRNVFAHTHLFRKAYLPDSQRRVWNVDLSEWRSQCGHFISRRTYW